MYVYIYIYICISLSLYIYIYIYIYIYHQATFKMSYKKRSGKIQDTLAKLLQEFEGNLKDATDAENKAPEGTKGVPRNGGRK